MQGNAGLVRGELDRRSGKSRASTSRGFPHRRGRRQRRLKRLLPSYADKRLLGAVAAMVITDDVARHAYRRGLFVIAQSGEHLVIRNDARFQPRSW